MTWPKWISIFALLAFAGCVTEKTAAEREQRAFEIGAMRMREELQLRESVVVFQGSVNNPFVEWEEGLTLANGIFAAEYVGRRAPRSIRIIASDGQTAKIDPDALLRGEDYFLQPGDIVELDR